jgi:hypothetical protein
MAITYEDMYQCSQTGNFDITANAILRGTLDYMNIATDLNDAVFVQPDNFVLYQNYPNPFNPTTSIQYTIGSRQFVTLKVYDVLGNEVSVLVNEEKSAGEYEIEFNSYSAGGNNIASGIYFYQLQTDNFIQTKKMILIQ